MKIVSHKSPAERKNGNVEGTSSAAAAADTGSALGISQ